MEEKKKVSLGRLFFATLILSAFTFGGGYVIITLMKKRFVDDYHWIDEKEMLDLWFQKNHFWYQGALESFLHPHPLSGELRKNTWEKDHGENY